MLQSIPRKTLRAAGVLGSFAALFLWIAEPVAAAHTPPAFKNLRGKYRGVANITIEKSKRRTLSGDVKIRVRLSRNKRVLQVSVTGDVLSNNKRGTLSSSYRFAASGSGRMRLNESVTPGSLKGTGTANIHRKGGRFTLRAFGYDSRGVSSGSIKLRGRTLLITQKFNAGNTNVSVSFIAPKTSR